VKERPILFSAPMVRALLAGTKTQTRRTVRMPEDVGEVCIDPGGTDVFGPGPYLKVYPRDHREAMHPRIRCPYGYPGDRLWVRETHARFSVGEGIDTPVPECVAYRATCDDDGGFDYSNGRGEAMRLRVTKWTPAIHMFRWASRITLEIGEVRVQRLQDITEADARAEGVTSRAAYAELWEGINGKRRTRVEEIDESGPTGRWRTVIDRSAGWAANPWVWAVGFERVEPALDAADIDRTFAAAPGVIREVREQCGDVPGVKLGRRP
jgi:hypothetical protein